MVPGGQGITLRVAEVVDTTTSSVRPSAQRIALASSAAVCPRVIVASGQNAVPVHPLITPAAASRLMLWRAQ